MAEQTQTEESGSVALPLAVGVGAGIGTKMLYSKAVNQLTVDALVGKEGVKAELATAAKDILKSEKLNTQFSSAQALATPAVQADIGKITIHKAAGKDAKGFEVTFHSKEGSKVPTKAMEGSVGGVAKLHVDSLPSDVVKAMGEKASHKIVDKELEALTKDGTKSWVARTAANAEKDVLKMVRGNEAWGKAGGGIKATIGHMGGGSKVLAGAAAIATVAGLGIGIKNMLGGSGHTNRVEVERNTPAQENTR